VPRYCNTLRHTETHWIILHHYSTHCNALQYTAIHCNTLQHTATRCNTLQHTATHHTTLRQSNQAAQAEVRIPACEVHPLQTYRFPKKCSQHTATRCNTLQHSATRCNPSPNEGYDTCMKIVLQCVAVCCSTLQCTAVCCRVLQ